MKRPLILLLSLITEYTAAYYCTTGLTDIDVGSGDGVYGQRKAVNNGKYKGIIFNGTSLSITSGIFTTRPNVKSLASGYVVNDNTDKKTKRIYPYKVVVLDVNTAIAVYNNTPYNNLTAAISAAIKKGGEVTVKNNTTETVRLPLNVSLDISAVTNFAATVNPADGRHKISKTTRHSTTIVQNSLIEEGWQYI